MRTVKPVCVILLLLIALLCTAGCSDLREKPSVTEPVSEVSEEVSEAPQEPLIDSVTTELDLSGLEPSQVADTVKLLGTYSALEKVELMDSEGNCALSVADVKALEAAAPDAVFHYTFELFGKTVSTTDEKIEYVKTKIGNKGEQELRDALDILCCCTYFKLDTCGFDSEVLAKVREDYPETKIVWRIVSGKRRIFTDTEMIRAVYNLDDSNSSELKYCNEVKYMDLGHNLEMSDISFLAYMPDIEIIILSGSPVTDLSPLANHDKLCFLELAYCGLLEDISPLKTCSNLEYLNISFTRVKDLSPIEDLPLKRMMYLGSKISEDARKEFTENHPDCWVKFDGKQPYGKGWRYNDDGHTYSDIYKKVREVFGYDLEVVPN